MANDKKISIDVTVTGDGQQQLNKYVQSFDNLRKSINGLSQPVNSFANSINSLDKNLSNYADLLNQINTQHNETILIGDKVHNKISEILTSFSTGIGVLKLFNLSLKALYVGLTGGLAIVTAFLPEIINFAKALFMGKDAVSAMAAYFKTLNEVMKASNKDAASEVTRLQVYFFSFFRISVIKISKFHTLRGSSNKGEKSILPLSLT